MSGRDRIFLGGAALATAVVPALLVLGTPFAETRAFMGIVVGWVLALLTIVPSYFLLSGALKEENSQRFFRAWAGGTMGRMFVVIVSVVLFAVFVTDAPVKSFLLSFFLGYMLLTGLEVLTVIGNTPNGRHA